MPYTDFLKTAVDQTLSDTRKMILALGRFPALLIVVANEDPASESYVRSKMRAANKLGILCDVLNVSSRFPSAELTKELEYAYKKYDAVIVQQPVNDLLEPFVPVIPPEQDVDGLFSGNYFTPCTADGIARALDGHYGSALSGKDVVIVGRSELVGRPLARMLAYGKFTVTLCHSKTKNLEEKCANADIVVCAVGKPHFLNYVPKVENQLVIDVGITRVDGKLKGDVHPDVAKYADVTPVPGGVGPLTVAKLMNNVAVAASLNLTYELE